MCRHWGWSSARIAYLDERMRWGLQDVMEENDALVATLMRSFLELNVAARQSGLSDKLCGEDFQLLSHKLTAAFGVKPGKQLLINPGIQKELTSSQIWLSKPTAQSWALADSNSGQALYTAASLQELLLWCSVNSIISAHTKLMWPGTPEVGAERARILIHNWVAQNNSAINLTAFKQQPRIEALLVIINWQSTSPEAPPAAQGGAFDVLNYGPNQLNLIQRLDCFTRNTWGEWACISFTGPEALVDYLRWCWRELAETCWQWMQCETVASHLGVACSQRVQQLMRALFNCFNRSDMRQRRFLFSFGGKHCCMQWQNDDLLPLNIYSERDLWNFLAVEQEVFCPLVVDAYSLPQQPLAVICQHVQAGVNQLFYCVAAQYIVLYICDDRGAILRLQLETQEKQQQLVHWIGFLRRALMLWQDQHPNHLGAINSLAVFEIIPQQQGFAVQRKSVHLELPAPSLAATISGGWSDDAQITLGCAGAKATWPYLAGSGPLNRAINKEKSAEVPVEVPVEESVWDHMARWLTYHMPVGQGIIRLDELGWPGAAKTWQLVSLVKCKLMVETQLNIARIRQRKRDGSQA